MSYTQPAEGNSVSLEKVEFVDQVIYHISVHNTVNCEP